MNYKIFYCFHRTDDKVPSSRPVEMERADIYGKLIGQLQEEDDFLGIIDENDNTLQAIYYPDENKYWVEIPVLEDRASYGKYMGIDELVDCIKALPKTFSLKDFPDFEFRKW